MPWGLQRFQETGQLHFLTFSCYKRRPNFANAPSRTTFETSLERARKRYGLCVYGYVVMPEHIHMLVNEPEQGSLSRVMQSLKQSVARTLALRAADPFWQARYHDFNAYDFDVMERAQVCREASLHSPQPGNSWVSCPSRRLARVERTLLSAAFNSCWEKTEWVETESQWTARRRAQAGILPIVRKHPAA